MLLHLQTYYGRKVQPTMIAKFSSLLAISWGIFLETALATTDYAVYYDTSATTYNPRGSGYRPDPPTYWDRVDEGTWPIFLDWGRYLEDPSDWNNGNECEDHSTSSYSTRHKQSPIKLEAHKTCNDRHKMIIVDKGQCQQGQAKFYTTPYGLGVNVTGCNSPFVLDHSLNEDEWYMEEIVLKVPAEHSIIDNVTGIERTFVGELQLGFRGSNDGYDPSTSHANNIAIIGVLLEVGTSSQADLELEKLIQGWESYMNLRYFACGKTYNHTTCRLQQSGRLRRELEKDETPASAFPAKPEEQRNLISSNWSKSCKSSFYCFVNLYLHTETDYYYNYLGSLTYPPCTETVHWRVMQQTMKISPGQLQRLQRLTYMHLDNNCQLATVGTKQGTSTCPCCVGVNRPRQALSHSHELRKCDVWVPESFVDNGTAATMSVQNGLF